jgi:hypothetical protein
MMDQIIASRACLTVCIQNATEACNDHEYALNDGGKTMLHCSHPFNSTAPLFFFLLVFPLRGVGRGKAKPRNSRLQLSQSKLYLNISLENSPVGRYPRLILLLLQLGHF